MEIRYHYADSSATGKPIGAIRSLLGMARPSPPSLAFAQNLKRLMEYHDLSQAALSKKTRIGQSTLSNLLDLSKPLEINPRATTIAVLAEFFSTPAWVLLIPDLPIELLVSAKVGALVENYRDATDEGKLGIERIAESEARYAKTSFVGNSRRR